MNLVNRIESLLRGSPIAKCLPFLKRNPKAYYFVMRMRERLLPLKLENGLSRYQRRAIDRFVHYLKSSPAESSARVLELGCDEDGNVALELTRRGFSSVVGINPYLAIWERESTTEKRMSETCVLQCRDARSTGYDNEFFSHIFSVATLEHVRDLPQALAEMYRILRPGGIFYADFNPIWSCGVGHHVYACIDGLEARHWKPETNPIPDHGHLLMSKSELDAEISGRTVESLKNEILKWVYDGDGINRLFYEDYVENIRESGFEIVQWTDTSEYVEGKKLKKLSARYPGKERFDVRGVEVILRKPKMV